MNHLCKLFGFIFVINYVLAETNYGVQHSSVNDFSSTTKKPAVNQSPNTNYEFGSDDSEKYFIKYPPPVAENLTQIPAPLNNDRIDESHSPKDYVTAALQQNHRHKKEATRKAASSFVEYTTLGTVRPVPAKKTSGSSMAFDAKKIKPLPKVSEKRHAEYFPYEPTFKIKDSFYSSSDASNYFSTQDAEHYPYETSVYQFPSENEATPPKFYEVKNKYEHKFPKTQDLPYYQSEEYLSKLKNAKQYHTTTEKPPVVLHMKPKELEKPPTHFYKAENLHEHHYSGKEYNFEPESNKFVDPNFSKPHQHSTQHETNHYSHFENPRPVESPHRPTHPPNHYEFSQHTTPTYSSTSDSSHHQSFVVNQEGAFHQTRPSQSPNFDSSYSQSPRPYLKETHEHPDLYVPHKEIEHQEYHFEPVKQKPKQKPQEPANYPSFYHETPVKTEGYLRPPKEPVTPEPEEETTIYVKVKNKSPEQQNRKPTARPIPHGTTVDSISINPSYYYKPKLCDAFADYELVRKGNGYEAQKKTKRESNTKKATKKSEEFYEQDEAADKQFFMMPEPQALVQQAPYPNDMNTEDSKNHKFVVVYHHEQKDQQKRKQPRKPENQKQVHSHTHYHNEPEKDYEETHEHINYPTEYTEEHQPDIVFHYEGDQSPMGSNSIKVVDPTGRNSQVEVTKEDYMRHIKLAAMKYLKEMEDSFGGKNSYYRPEAPIQDINNIQFGKQTFGDSFFQSSKRIPIAVSTPASFRAPFPQPTEYNLAASAKVPKNTFSAGKPLKNAISNLQTTLGQNANPIYRPMKTIAGYDNGHGVDAVFDHTAVLRNLQGFDMSNVVNNPQFPVTTKPRLHFNKQTYHDINSMMHKDFQQQPALQFNEKGYNSYLEPQPASFTSIQGNSANVGASISFGQKLNQNKVYGDHDSIEGPIQIINGLPITNPYNIDVKTLRYMLGGLAQAEVDDHLKEYNHGAIKVKPKLQGHTPLQQFASNSPILAAMEQSLNNLKITNPNKNFNNNDINGYANGPKFNSNGNKNRNVRDSMDNNVDYSEDLGNWSSSKISKSTNSKSKEGAPNGVVSNAGKTSAKTAKTIAKDLISNASNLAPGQYIVRPVKKPQSKNSIFPFIFSRRSEELITDLRPPPANQRSDDDVATTAVAAAT